MASADQYANWIVKNSDKKGTPEFETVAAAYKEARGESESTATKGDIKGNQIYDGENWTQIYADEPPPEPIKPPQPSLLSKAGSFVKNAVNGAKLGGGGNNDETLTGKGLLKTGITVQNTTNTQPKTIEDTVVKMTDSELNKPIQQQVPFDVRMREKRRLEATAKAQLFSDKVKAANEGGTPDTALKQAIETIPSTDEVNQRANSIANDEFIKQDRLDRGIAEPKTNTERYARDFSSGELSSTASALSYIGKKTGVESLSKLGDSMGNYAQDQQPLQQDFTDQLVSGIGSTTSFYVPGLGVEKGVKALSIISPVLAKWTGAGTMAALEASMEADGVYKTLKSEGASEQDAMSKADTAFLANVAMLGITDKIAFFNDIKIFNEATGKISKTALLAKAGTTSSAEFTQEGLQQVTSNYLSNRPLMEGVLDSAVIGGIVGLGGIATGGSSNPNKERITNLINSGKLNQLGSGDLGLKIKQAQKYGWNDVESVLNEELSRRVTKPSNSDIAATVTQAGTLDEAISASADILDQYHESSDHLKAAQQGFTDEEILQNLEAQHPILAAHTDALDTTSGDNNVSNGNNTADVVATASEPLADNATGSLGNLPETSRSANAELGRTDTAETPTRSNASNLAIGNGTEQNAPLNDLTTAVGNPINKEWTAFHEESGTKAIPRNEMPQIKSEHRGALVNFLNARGISHEQETVTASSLKPTQAEFSSDKVAKAMGFEGTDRSILVSSDNHILDGHHQWLAKLADDEKVNIIRLNAPIDELIKQVKEFPSATTARGSSKKTTGNDLFEKNREAIKSLLPKMAWGTIGNKRINDAQGNQIGRTKFVPIDEELDSIRKSGVLSYNAMQNAVNKALNGESLTKQEHNTVDLIAEYADKNAEALVEKPITDEQAVNIYKAREAEGNKTNFEELFYGDGTNVTKLSDEALFEGIGNEVSLEYFEQWLNKEGLNNEQKTSDGRVETQVANNEPATATTNNRQDTQQDNGIKRQSAPITTQKSEREGVRPLVEALVKRRSAAAQMGKEKAFDSYLKLAKSLMNGEEVKSSNFKLAADTFKGDAKLTETFSSLFDLAKAPAKAARTEIKSAIADYQAAINSAKTQDELQALASKIQNDKTLSDNQAADLDDAVFEAQDKLIEEENASNDTTTTETKPIADKADLLGDDTKGKQAIADADRAKDAKRNTGTDNADSFNLTGSDSEADKAIAAGAQDLFSEPKKSTETENNYNLSENDVEPRFLNKRSKLIEIDGKKITPSQAFKLLSATRDDMNNHRDFIKCMGA